MVGAVEELFVQTFAVILQMLLVPYQLHLLLLVNALQVFNGLLVRLLVRALAQLDLFIMQQHLHARLHAAMES